MSNFKDAEKQQYKKGNSTNWRPESKDTQAPQPKMGRFVEGEHINKISQPRMKAIRDTRTPKQSQNQNNLTTVLSSNDKETNLR